MAKHKFLSILAGMDKKEISAFGNHLRTAHAREKIALRVFDYFKKFHPEFDGEKTIDLDLAAQKIAKLGVATAQYRRKNLLDTFHDLHIILKQFLLSKKLGDDSPESEILWLLVLKERGMMAAFEKGANRLFEQIKSTPKADTQDYLKLMLVEYLSTHGQVGDKAPTDDMLAAYSQALETFYQISRLKINCETINRRNQKGGVERDMLELPPNSQALESQNLWTLYHKVQLMLQGGDEADYLLLEKQMVESSKFVSKNELFAACIYLKNYCAKKVREGHMNFSKNSHKIDKFGLERGLFTLDNGFMSPGQFFNIITAATAAGEFQWAEGFVKQCKSWIEEPICYEVRILADAMLLFAKKQYDHALNKLKALEGYRLGSAHFDIRGRLLKVASMAGLDLYSDELITEIVNCRAHLIRAATPHGETVKASLNFLNIVQMMHKQRRDKERIEQEINAAKDSLVYEPWLLERLESYQPIR